MATATEAKAKAIVTTKMMADGTMKTVASKLITNRLAAACGDCRSLANVPHLKDKAESALTAIDALLDDCDE